MTVGPNLSLEHSGMRSRACTGMVSLVQTGCSNLVRKGGVVVFDPKPGILRNGSAPKCDPLEDLFSCLETAAEIPGQRWAGFVETADRRRPFLGVYWRSAVMAVAR